MRPLRVYPLPPLLLHNPYLDLLYGAMEGMPEVEVRRLRPVWHELREMIVEGEPHLFHLHFFDELYQRPSPLETRLRASAFLWMLRVLKLRGVRLVWTVHNIVPHELHHPDVAAWLYRQLFRQVEAAIVHSEGAAAIVRQHYAPPCPLHVIPHGHYIGVYGPPVERALARRRLALPPDGFLFATVGTLRPYKGLDGLIRAFRRLPRPDVRLLIAGAAKSPDYSAPLRREAAGDGRILLREGFIPDTAMADYAAAADVIVLPYTRLLTSGALLWAFSYHRPVIAPAHPAIADLVREGETGWGFVAGDEASLKRTLMRALEKAPALTRMGEAAFALARQRDWDSIARRTVALYLKVMQGG